MHQVMKEADGCRRGDVVEVMAGALALPFGLGHGFQVRVVARSGETAVVEREGREWRVPRACLRRRTRGVD